MPKSNKLKPCPFCGTRPTLKTIHEYNDPSQRLFYAYCCDSARCPAVLKMGWETSREIAVKLWNTRRKPRRVKNGK